MQQNHAHLEAGLLAEAHRRQALLQQDWPTLASLLADELVYVHSTAARDSKATLLHKLQSGQIRYRALSFDDLQGQPLAQGVMITGRMSAEVEKEGQIRQVRSLFMTVWRLQENAQGDIDCQLLGHQGTPLPA
jgi:hypothetical protein